MDAQGMGKAKNRQGEALVVGGMEWGGAKGLVGTSQ